MLLNLLTLTSTLGFMVMFWQDGRREGAVRGARDRRSDPLGPAHGLCVPVRVSMDYEVFILARIREEYGAQGATDKAVVEGITRTGRLIPSAALILFLAFLALATDPAPTSRCSRPPSGSGSCSTRPSSGLCSCQPSCPCSATGTGGCLPGWRGCCASTLGRELGAVADRRVRAHRVDRRRPAATDGGYDPAQARGVRTRPAAARP